MDDSELLVIVNRIITKTQSEEDEKILLELFPTEDGIVGILKKLARRHPFKNPIRSAIAEDTPLAEGIYQMLFGLDGKPICHHGMLKSFSKTKLEYTFCGSSCKCKGEYLAQNYRNKSEEDRSLIRARHAAVMEERYGTKTYLTSDHYREKLQNELGVDNIAKATATKEKTRKTNEKRYGGHHARLTRAKTEKTNLERYGATAPMASEDIKSKAKTTSLDRYGGHPMKNDEVRARHANAIANVDRAAAVEKSRQTNLERRGAWPAQVPEIREKLKKTNIERYGGHPQQQDFSEKTRDIILDATAFSEFMKDRSYAIAALELDVNQKTIHNYCKKYGIDRTHSSSYEEEIAAFLISNGVSFKKNDRTIIRPKELDFVLPDFSLAIEFNGLYYHSEEMVGKTYHAEKLSACENAGLRLLSINEDEWVYANGPVRHKILNLLGKSEKGVGARKLAIRAIDHGEAYRFFDQHHIQGRPGTLLASYGAYWGDTLVGAMAFNAQRKTGEVELIRFCSDGKVYPGMFSKLFKEAVSNHDWRQVISFADRRYSRGEVYENNGFEFVSIASPDYRYFKQLKTYHKSTFTKKKIEKRFGIIMEDTTERQAMETLGYSRIYDCGKLKYLWKRN